MLPIRSCLAQTTTTSRISTVLEQFILAHSIQRVQSYIWKRHFGEKLKNELLISLHIKERKEELREVHEKI